MALKFNNTDVDNVLFNGTQLEELQLNGATVWTHTSPVPSGTVIFEQGNSGSYTANIPSAGEYYCTVVGAGGGAALSMHTVAHNSSAMPSAGSLICGGGTGAYIQATVRFDSPCTLNITVGAKGQAYSYYKLNAVTGDTWYVNGGVGTESKICSELTKVVMQANGGGRGMIKGKVSTSSFSGNWYDGFTSYSVGAGGGWSWHNQSGVTVYNIVSAKGFDGTLAANGTVTGYGNFTATASILLAPNMVTGYGAGGGGTATTKRVSGGTDSANWNYAQGTYGPNDGYVKIVKA